MPHDHGRRGPPHRHRHALSSLSAAADAESLTRALEMVVPDARDAAFVARNILGEGPAHHRASSWALVVMLAEIARRMGCAPADPGEQSDAVPIPLRLPPHRARHDDVFPIGLPLEPLRTIVERERDVEALADALVDGPPHHALANAALVALFDRIFARLAEDEPDPG